MRIKNLFKYWNKSSGVMLILTKDSEMFFVEINGFFIFRIIKLYFLYWFLNKQEKEIIDDFKLVYEDNWGLINRYVEYKKSEDEDVREMFSLIIKGLYEKAD